jgi:hypothetical protein
MSKRGLQRKISRSHNAVSNPATAFTPKQPAAKPKEDVAKEDEQIIHIKVPPLKKKST